MPVAERAWPVVGQAPAFLADRLGFMESLAREHGPVAEVRLGRELSRLLCDPEDIRHVLVSNARAYEKTPRMTSAFGRTEFGEGLLTARGDFHRERRLQLQPLFHMRVLERFEPAVHETCARAVAQWPALPDIDLAHATAAFARRVICLVLAGSELADDRQFQAAIVARQRFIDHLFSSVLPLRERLPTRVRRDGQAARRLLRERLTAAAAARAAAPTDDLLSLLVEALPQEAAVDEALTLLVTGFETLGEALAWTLHLVAANPAVERELLAGTDPGLAQRVISESLRQYPPTWIFVRIAQEADTLPGGTRLEAGAKLYLCPWVLHRDPAWWPEPGRFDPGRFDPAAIKARPKHAFLPFGSGPHVCIGEGLARMELGIALDDLLPRLRFPLAPGADPTPVPRITLRPRRLLVAVERRP